MDPLQLASQSVIATRRTVEQLVTSSESFDYPGAKAALKRLRKQIRDLGKLQAKFEALKAARQADICVVDFGKGDDGYSA